MGSKFTPNGARLLLLTAFLSAVLVLAACDQVSNQHPKESMSEAGQPKSSQVDIRGWSPDEACSYLEPSLSTRGYKKGYGDEYHCSSPYKDIDKASTGLPNNLAYYGVGKSNVAETLMLVLNYNQPSRSASATEVLISESESLAVKATGKEIPELILKAMSLDEPAEEIIDGIHHEVKRGDWPTGRGYEVHYILTKVDEK